MAVFGTKIKKGVWNQLLVDILLFFHKNVPYLILYHLTKFQFHTFFSFIKQNVL